MTPETVSRATQRMGRNEEACERTGHPRSRTEWSAVCLRHWLRVCPREPRPFFFLDARLMMVSRWHRVGASGSPAHAAMRSRYDHFNSVVVGRLSQSANKSHLQPRQVCDHLSEFARQTLAAY